MTTSPQASRATLSGGTSARIALPHESRHALLYSEIPIEFSLDINGVDGSNEEQLRRHPGQGFKVLSVAEREVVGAVFAKSVDPDAVGLVEAEVLHSLGDLVPGQFIPLASDRVPAARSYVRLSGAVGQGAVNDAVLLFVSGTVSGDDFAVTHNADAATKIVFDTAGKYLVVADVGLDAAGTVYILNGTLNNTLVTGEIQGRDEGTAAANAAAVVHAAADDELYVRCAVALDGPNSLTVYGPL
ncbi:MAG: hypothetical protein CVV27_02385 [Candidatus Melainabacteria bacterium HGW-Melainabacteria-1]|nr:MAG: hypothetical protein CVV27_02385 [Candidatus Melainabacteria bacterium HGW-Melainabacteria-1]